MNFTLYGYDVGLALPVHLQVQSNHSQRNPRFRVIRIIVSPLFSVHIRIILHIALISFSFLFFTTCLGFLVPQNSINFLMESLTQP